MGHYWFYGTIVGETWHGKQNARGATLRRGVSTKEGIDLSHLRDVNWNKIPVVALSHSGAKLSVDGQYMLEREPFPFVNGDDYYIVPNRFVGEEFELVQGTDLANLAEGVSNQTGWKFMGAAQLKNGEIQFIQLEIDKDFCIAGKEHEAHKAKLFFGDDKGGGATFGGITYTRIQCWNTWRAALSGDGVWRLRHDDNPKARMEFAAAQIVEAYKAMAEEEEWLNRFFTAPLADHLFDQFVHNVYPDPNPTEAMLAGVEAQQMVIDNRTNGYDLKKVIDLGLRSQNGYEQRLELARRRRNFMNGAYARHNSTFTDSANTYYAAAQALTESTTHGPFRGNGQLGSMFGIRADYTTNGLNWLKAALIEEQG